MPNESRTGITEIATWKPSGMLSSRSCPASADLESGDLDSNQVKRSLPQCSRCSRTARNWLSIHSPFVVSRVQPECVRLLRDFQVFEAPAPTEGRDPNSLYLEVFGVPLRPPETERKLARIAELIDQELLDDARKEIGELSRQFGDHDAEITRLRSLVDLLGV